jgi:hypothetical protein
MIFNEGTTWFVMNANIFNLSITLGSLVIVNPHLMWMLTTSKQHFKFTFFSSFIIMLCMIAHAYKIFKPHFDPIVYTSFELCNTFKFHSTSFAFHLISKMFLFLTKQFVHNLHKNWPSLIDPINKKKYFE